MWKRLALTLSSQLPDDAAIARLVLGYVNELQDFVHATGQPAVGIVVAWLTHWGGFIFGGGAVAPFVRLGGLDFRAVRAV
jgi:hypothetical protein